MIEAMLFMCMLFLFLILTFVRETNFVIKIILKELERFVIKIILKELKRIERHVRKQDDI